LPWEQPLNQILQSVEGPVAKIIAVIIIVVTGLTLAFGDSSGGFRRLIQIVFGLSIAFCRVELLPVVLLLRWRRGDLMDEPVAGFVVPVHRALTEPILMGGAPRAVAIVNGTLAAALGLGLRLWIAVSSSGSSATWPPSGAAKRDPPRRCGASTSAHSRHPTSEFLP